LRLFRQFHRCPECGENWRVHIDPMASKIISVSGMTAIAIGYLYLRPLIPFFALVPLVFIGTVVALWRFLELRPVDEKS